MENYSSLENVKENEPLALSIGVFDGVHLGHQQLLKTLTEQGMKSAVLTFKNHPKAIILKTPTRYIHPFNQRIDLLKKQGIDLIIALEFTEEFRKLTAKEFLNLCQQALNLKRLVLGYDTALGSDRMGDIEAIQKLLPESTSVLQSPPYYKNEILVSSQKIREAIELGDFKQTATLLGRSYSLEFDLKERLDVATGEIFVKDLVLPPPGFYNNIEITPEKKMILRHPQHQKLLKIEFSN